MNKSIQNGMTKKTSSLLAKYLPLSGAVLFVALCLTIPQIRMGALPIGYDVSAAYLAALIQPHPQTLELTSFNLLYYLLSQIYTTTHIDILLLLKITGVVLPILTSLAVTWLASLTLRLKPWQVALFFIVLSLQMGYLRLSWDLYRNLLGLLFACLAAAMFYKGIRPLNLFWLLGAAGMVILTILSHQIVSYLLFIGAILSLPSVIIPASQFRKRWLYTIVLLVILLIISPSISLGSFHLFINQEIDPSLVVQLHSLSTNLVLIGIALIGAFAFRSALLATITIYIAFLSTSPLWSGYSAYLWDRWAYFLVIPLTFYAITGIKQLALHFKIPEIKTWILFASILSLPGFCYTALFFPLPRTSTDIYNHFPQRFFWNSIGYDSLSNLNQSLDTLRSHDDKVSPIVSGPQYDGILHYLAPDLHSRLVILPPASTLQAVPYPRYYLYGYNYGKYKEGILLEGSTKSQPVRFYEDPLNL